MITNYELYSDESGRESGPFLIGGVIVTERGSGRLATKLAALRSEKKLSGEMRWTKVSAAFLGAYKEWLEVFFSDPHARFACLIIDKGSPEWKEFYREKHEYDHALLSAYYQFMLVAFGGLGNKRWTVRHDAGLFRDEEAFQRLRHRFNSVYRRAFGPKSPLKVRFMQTRDSKDEDMIQLADVILGAVSCRVVGCAPESEARRQLLEFFGERCDAAPFTRQKLEKVSCRNWVAPDSFRYGR